MGIDRETQLGGPNRGFPTTCWTEIVEIGDLDEESRRRQLGQLLMQYWKPVYHYLYCKGHNSEDAKDITQDFFHEIVLGRDLIHRAQKTKGRFRSFLLSALSNYVINQHEHETAQKRCPKDGVIPLDAMNPEQITVRDESFSPEDAFNYTWASELLRMVYEEVEDYCQNTGKQIYWSVFRIKVMEPILERKPAPALRDVCEELGIDQEATASNMIRTVKRIFQTTMNKHLSGLVESQSEINEEFNELMAIFSKN